MHTRTQMAGQILACCLLAAASTFGSSQASAPAKPAVGAAIPPAQIYGKLLSQLESEFVSAAEAMPEDTIFSEAQITVRPKTRSRRM